MYRTPNRWLASMVRAFGEGRKMRLLSASDLCEDDYRNSQRGNGEERAERVAQNSDMGAFGLISKAGKLRRHSCES